MTNKIMCPCCGPNGNLKPYQTRKDATGNVVDIEICETCTTIVNRSTLEIAEASAAETIAMQAESSKSFYDIDRMAANLATEVDAIENVLTFMFEHASSEIPRGVAVDLGAGYGHMAAAAARHFDQSWAIDINRWTLDRTLPLFNAPNLHAGTDLAEVPGEIGAIFMWHTLEHIPRAWEVATIAASKLTTSGVFFFQVPMYADDYVIESHYTFFNKNSIPYFADQIGLSVEGIWYDVDQQFITALLRKMPVHIPATTVGKARDQARSQWPSIWQRMGLARLWRA